MPRKYNDPIMKSKNAQTNGGAASSGSDDGIQYTPGYIPETLKNGIDFSDLSDSLRKAIGGTYNFKTGDSSFNFIGGGNGVNLTSLSDIPNQIGQNGIDLASLLALMNQNGGNGINLSSLLDLINQGGGSGFGINGGNGIDLSSLLGLLNQNGGNGIDLASLLSMLNQNGDDANLLGLISAFGGGGGNISLVGSTADYDWFKLPISNKLSAYDYGLVPGTIYSLNLIVYHDILVNAANQKIIYGDYYNRFWFKNADNEWELGKPSFVPAMRQATLYSIDTVDTTNNQVFKPIIEAERTSLTPTTTTLATPTFEGTVVRDVGFVLGQAYSTPYDKTKRFDGARASWYETTGEIENYHVTAQHETAWGEYSIADSPLTYMYVSGNYVYNYSVYNMRCNIVRIIICNELS